MSSAILRISLVAEKSLNEPYDICNMAAAATNHGVLKALSLDYTNVSMLIDEALAVCDKYPNSVKMMKWCFIFQDLMIQYQDKLDMIDMTPEKMTQMEKDANTAMNTRGDRRISVSLYLDNCMRQIFRLVKVIWSEYVVKKSPISSQEKAISLMKEINNYVNKHHDLGFPILRHSSQTKPLTDRGVPHHTMVSKLTASGLAADTVGDYLAELPKATLALTEGTTPEEVAKELDLDGPSVALCRTKTKMCFSCSVAGLPAFLDSISEGDLVVSNFVVHLRTEEKTWKTEQRVLDATSWKCGMCAKTIPLLRIFGLLNEHYVGKTHESLRDEIKSKLLQKVCNAALAQKSDLMHICQNRECADFGQCKPAMCYYTNSYSPETQVFCDLCQEEHHMHVHRSKCSKCSTFSCTVCRSLGFHDDRACLGHNDDMDDETRHVLMSGGARRCPKCRTVIVKNGGCDHITCTCGAHFCYLCSRELDPRLGLVDHVCPGQNALAYH